MVTKIAYLRFEMYIQFHSFSMLNFITRVFQRDERNTALVVNGCRNKPFWVFWFFFEYMVDS